MGQKQHKKLRKELKYKPQRASIHDPKHYRRSSDGSLRCIGVRNYYHLAKKVLRKEQKGS